MKKLLIAALALFLGQVHAFALDPLCTTTSVMRLAYCPENSTDWYPSYTGMINAIESRTALSSFTVTGDIGITTAGGSLTIGGATAIIRAGSNISLGSGFTNVQIGNNGTPLALISTGTYTPTLTNVTNVAASAVSTDFQYFRIGNLVYVTGGVTIDPTAGGNTATELGITIPIASNFTGSYDANGGISFFLTQAAGIVFGDSSNDRASVQFSSEVTANTTCMLWFLYVIK
jgi:hypothetical protein